MSATATAAPVPAVVPADAVRFGDWFFSTEDKSTTIYPINARTGKSMRVHTPRAVATMRHTTVQSVLSFSKYRTLGRWFYRDSRRKQPVSRTHVVTEIARMVGCDHPKAELIVDSILPV